MEIGIKLKEMRLQCGLTQEELADRSELTKGFISQLENDLTSPSITTLIDILGALGSDLKEFFSDATDDKVVFTKGDFFEKVTDEQKITWVVPNSQKNMMEPILLTIMPKCRLTEDMPHEGEEFGYILEGSAVLHIGKKMHNLAAGDSFYFTSKKVHFIENKSNNETKIIWVSCPPTF